VRSAGPTIDASLPFVKQARKLVSKAELRGLVADLVPTVPALARLNNATVGLLHQVRLASSCQNQVILPWSQDQVVDPNFPTNMGGGKIQLKVFEEGVRFLPGIASESRTGDANGQWFRVLPGNGTNTYDLGLAGQKFVGQSLFPILGANPPRLTQPPIRPHVPCETQHKPNLTTIQGSAPVQLAASKSSPASKVVANESAAYITATLHNQQVRQLLPKPTPAQAKQLATTDQRLAELRKKWVEDFKKMAGG
jgi:hypothetical protein